MNEQQRKLWRHNLLDAIRELSDLDYQRSAWLGQLEASPHFSFVEFTECYYDAVGTEGYGPLLDAKLVTAAEVELVNAFHEMLDSYEPPGNASQDHEAILTDPHWHDVVRCAKSTLQQLDSSVR